MALLSEEQRWFDRASRVLTPEFLGDLICRFVSVPSPPGGELPLAAAIVDTAKTAGLSGDCQRVQDEQANAVLRYGVAGRAPVLLLYSPIDTHVAGQDVEDVPQVGVAVPDALRPRPHTEGPYVVGLGANNPKGHAAAVMAVLVALAKAEVPLSGQVIGGFGAGGMPTNGRPHVGIEAGNGSGCSFMLERGVQADAAIIAKPGRSVSWEEVGLLWVRVRVAGRMHYTGTRHRSQTPNAVVQAARLIGRLEEWFPQYTARHTAGTLAPQGMVGAVDGGWPYKVAFAPAVCDVHVDLRVHAQTPPLAVFRELNEFLHGLNLSGAHLEAEPVLSIAGSSTPPTEAIVGSCIDAWEYVHGQTHVAAEGLSGATDANILRREGIPTARLGMPPLDESAPLQRGFEQSMNVVDTRQAATLSRALLYAVMDTCGIDPR